MGTVGVFRLVGGVNTWLRIIPQENWAEWEGACCQWTAHGRQLSRPGIP